MELIKRLANLQDYVVNLPHGSESDYSDYDLIMFEYSGIMIHNPFLDESGRFNVDPIKYYGECFLKSEWAKFI